MPGSILALFLRMLFGRWQAVSTLRSSPLDGTDELLCERSLHVRDCKDGFDSQAGRTAADLVMAIVQAAAASGPCILAESWPIEDVSTTIVGTGFHRTLQYSWRTATTCSSAMCEPAADLPARCQMAPCSLRIIQPLPAALFADPYQLAEVTKLISAHSTGLQWNATVLGSLNLETTALESNPTELVLQLRYGSSCRALNRCEVLRVPLHARYPAAVFTSGPGLGATWATVHVPLAKMLLAHGGESVWRAVLPSSKERDPNASALSWDIPAGALSHSTPIAAATCVAIGSACTLVLFTMAGTLAAIQA